MKDIAIFMKLILNISHWIFSISNLLDTLWRRCSQRAKHRRHNVSKPVATNY